MPTYIYRREDGTTFEIEQRITADALETCPTTGQPVKRVITGGTGLIFKGTGFYQTDYVRGNGVDKKDADKKGTDKKKKTASDKATDKGTESSEKSATSSEESSKPASSKDDD